MAATFETHSVQRAGRSISVILRPATLTEALQLLAEDSTRRPLAGGSDILLDLHRGGPGSPVELIDLTSIGGFDRIEDAGDTLKLGGGVRHGQVVSDQRFIERATPLAQACFEIGSPQLRNRATIAGNLATASPANDTLAALIALSARVEVSRWNGADVVARWVDVDQFFTGFRSTVLADDELITEIAVPTLSEGMRGIWVKLGNRRAQAISVIHAGFVVHLEDGRVRSGRMAFGSVAPVVRLAEAGTSLLTGASLDEESIAEIAASVADEFTPIDDVRATADYRTQALGTLVQRALTALRDGNHRDRWPEASPQLVSSLQGMRPAAAPPVVDDSTP
ncbi:MAG: FAD binding domain-containing protein, partial [Acidimicrobiia bacterium]